MPLSDHPIAPTLPAADIERAKAWYKEKLGFSPDYEDPGGVFYRTGKTAFSLYPSEFSGSAQNTMAGWMVTDLDGVMGEMIDAGVQFEQYDLPGLKTDEKGVAHMGEERGCWFKDTEGNILSIFEIKGDALARMESMLGR